MLQTLLVTLGSSAVRHWFSMRLHCIKELRIQGPAWGGIAIGASPPAPGADANLQEALPRLTDIQAEQERVRESCSRSFGAAGSSPANDGFSLLHW